MGNSLKLTNRLQADLGIANLGNQSRDIAQTMVLLPEQTPPDFLAHKAQCRACLLQMLAGFVNRCVGGLFRAGRDSNGALDLFPANPAQVFPKRFFASQFVAHIDLFARQFHIAIALFAGYFPPKPAWRLESPAARLAWELHFGNHETMIAAVINVDLDLEIFPRNFIAGFT